MAKKHAHHGGAWKVAYADFVTAMMALFLVLWLTSQDEKIKEAVERSFRNPFSSITKESTGLIPSKDSQSAVSQKGNFDSASAVELNMLRKISEDLLKAFQQGQDQEDDPIKMEMSPEGLRVNVFDRGHQPVFEPNSAEFTKYGKWLFSTLAWQVSRYPKNFLMELEGHTEAGHPPKDELYSNWELSTDRANSARRILQEHGVKAAQVRKVAGFSDTKPLAEMDGADERNRRVTVLLRMENNLD
ncbi:MAG TPA: flagellar motor protein MotB [Verrucomicrobiae bacterium]|nr:flagellar motor protein MotB [Verrucomicrobiae bacterium]